MALNTTQQQQQATSTTFTKDTEQQKRQMAVQRKIKSQERRKSCGNFYTSRRKASTCGQGDAFENRRKSFCMLLQVARTQSASPSRCRHPYRQISIRATKNPNSGTFGCLFIRLLYVAIACWFSSHHVGWLQVLVLALPPFFLFFIMGLFVLFWRISADIFATLHKP